MNVSGHDRAVALLQRALSSGRLAGTWMFAGPRGVGKFTLAVGLAKAVLCDRPRKEKNGGRIKTLENQFELTLACGECESCRAVDAGNHPDLHVITKELIRYHDRTGKSKGTTLSIDVIRGEITGDSKEGKEAKIYKRSFRGRGKFFIIDEADLMEVPAQNALLKTLEEPPASGGGSYLILITASPQELLATIRSRSQLVEFGGLPESVITERLAEAGLGKKDSALLARLARGSLGLAMRWAREMQVIDEKNQAAAERAAKKGSEKDDDEDETSTNKFTPGGILGWTRELGAALDGLVAGRVGATEIAGLIAKFAAEYSALALMRDRLASADRAKRDGIQLLMGICAEWFSDRLRHALGTPYGQVLPGESGALDYGLAPE